MKVLASLLNVVDNINEWIGKIVGFLIITLTAIIFFDVFLRYLFNSPIYWAMEINEYQLITLVLLTGGYTYLHNGHVRVDIIHSKWSKKTRAKVDLFTSLLVFLVCFVLVRYGIVIAYNSFIHHYTASTVLASPLWPTHFMIPLGALLLGLQCLSKWIRDFVFVFTGTKLESQVFRGEGGIITMDREE